MRKITINKKILTTVSNAFSKNDFILHIDNIDCSLLTNLDVDETKELHIKAVQEKFTRYDGNLFKYYLNSMGFNNSSQIPPSDSTPPFTPEIEFDARITGENPLLEISLNEEKGMYSISVRDMEIYNPWSVTNYFNNMCDPQAYWINTSENSILRELLAEINEEAVKLLLVNLILAIAVDIFVFYGVGMVLNSIKEQGLIFYLFTYVPCVILALYISVKQFIRYMHIKNGNINYKVDVKHKD